MTRTVLIVDDSLTVRMDLVHAFEAAGFRPIPCGSAAGARNTLALTPVDVAILDVVLPDGDGIELLAELRSSPALAGIVILMLSTEAEVADRIRGLRTGADEYVGKPYDVGYVIAKTRELLRAREAPSDGATTVLVIEDSLTFRHELARALEREGYAVTAVETGEDGLRAAASQRPDAIVVDKHLPGIEGPAVIRHIRLDPALRSVPCLLLTASDEDSAELQALDAGADAFVRKGDIPVLLARLAAALRSTTAPAADEGSSLSGPKKILAVDDSRTYLETIAASLRGEGYDVILAHSGEEACELLASQPVDCILLDLLMPGLSGRDTCLRIKSAPMLRDIPILMLTALEDSEAMIGSLAAGADDFIQKSSEFEILRARVRAQIRRKLFEDENRRVREELLRTELEAAEARAARALAEARAVLVDELERKNEELAAFSYSVSHDLRGPLQALLSFAEVLEEEYAHRLDDRGRDFLRRIRRAGSRMDNLINSLLRLSHVSDVTVSCEVVDLSALVRACLDELRAREPSREVTAVIADGATVRADRRLMEVLVDNLVGNAWKYTAKVDAARLEFGFEQRDEVTTYFVRDNGAGFDMKFADAMFRPFRRLHAQADFPGSGIGLATVRRVVDRHGGRIWAEGEVQRGATFYFAIPAPAATLIDRVPSDLTLT